MGDLRVSVFTLGKWQLHEHVHSKPSALKQGFITDSQSSIGSAEGESRPGDIFTEVSAQARSLERLVSISLS